MAKRFPYEIEEPFYKEKERMGTKMHYLLQQVFYNSI